MDGQATTEQDVAARVRQLTPAVRKLAYHMMSKLPASVEMEDLTQSGMLGLIDAAKRYEGGEGTEFATYATYRIRGAMLDSLRQLDWLPRQVRSDMRRAEAMIARLEQRMGRPPSEAELAKELDMSLGEYQQLLFEARAYRIVAYEDLCDGDNTFLERHVGGETTDPLVILEQESVRETLIKAIEALPEREKTVLALYYQEELKQHEIGEVLNVTESRVCQILSQATARIRVALRPLLQQ
jgi:RNA polymerase sigma factor for flagellar operon FliA